MWLRPDDRFSRTDLAASSRSVFTLRLPFLFFLSFALIVLSRLGHPAVKELRAEAEGFIAPALGAAMLPLEPVRRLVRQVQSSYDNFADLERLRAENQRLRQWETRSRDLERKVGELAILAKALEQQRIEYRTVRVIATASGALLHSALLEAGRDHGIKVGQPVINADGILGRIVEAGRRTSRLLLLTDINSRVPVVIGTAQIRAILAGDNGPEPRLMLLPHGISVDPGEEVLTSGLGGMFPRGMRIGATTFSSGVPRVALGAGLGELEYVSVLLYDNPGIALTTELRTGHLEPANGRPRSNGEKEGRP